VDTLLWDKDLSREADLFPIGVKLCIAAGKYKMSCYLQNSAGPLPWLSSSIEEPGLLLPVL
jgi:hypothetical protein